MGWRVNSLRKSRLRYPRRKSTINSIFKAMLLVLQEQSKWYRVNPHKVWA
jgi:hypothetical protein